jgi:hypothetical protein
MSVFGPPGGKTPVGKAAASVLVPRFPPQPSSKFLKRPPTSAAAVQALAGTPINKPVMSAVLRSVSPPRDPATPPRASSSAASDPAKSAVASRGANGRSITFKNKPILKIIESNPSTPNEIQKSKNTRRNSEMRARRNSAELRKHFGNKWVNAQVVINSNPLFSRQFYQFLRDRDSDLETFKTFFPGGIPQQIYAKLDLPPKLIAEIKQRLGTV